MYSQLETVAESGLLIGLVAYAILVIFFIYGWSKRISGRAALIASVLTMTWFGAFASLGQRPVTDMVEISAYAAWIALLTRILGIDVERFRNPIYRSQTGIAILTAVVYAVALFTLSLPQYFDALDWPLLLKLFFCIVGIVTLEQVARNTRRDHQWNIKFLIIGLGIVFTYGFALYADALLFSATNLKLLAPQGYIYAVAAPFICIASLRNASHPMNVNLSRSFVFRTGSLLLTGGYLLIMGTAGYYVRFFGGEWGDVFQVFLVCAGLIGLVVVAVSGQVRNALRMAITRNLFKYKYDYRDEWLRVTRELTQIDVDEGLGTRAIHALKDLLHANAGAYWRLSNENVLLPVAQIGGGQWSWPLSLAGSRSAAAFFDRLGWIVDLEEYRRSPSSYDGLELGVDLNLLEGARFLVPLPVEERLFGIIAIGPPSMPMTLTWEDYDILKVIARQTAAFLALQHADSVLSASKQLRAMDQMSAFVIHDLKTVNAQLGLLLHNAERHKRNPAFIDDMLTTTENAVARMTKLVDHLRAKDPTSTATDVDLIEVVKQAVHDRMTQQPQPKIEQSATSISIRADPDRLRAVLSHVVQNAQDATPAKGTVQIRVAAAGVWATVTVTDTGHGMKAEFIEKELFAPFVTTKGVSGIGVGAYQCREYVRSLGGDVSVRSQCGVGTEFTLRLPLAPASRVEALT